MRWFVPLIILYCYRMFTMLLCQWILCKYTCMLLLTMWNERNKQTKKWNNNVCKHHHMHCDYRIEEKKTAHTSTIAGDFSVCPFTSQFNVFDGMIRWQCEQISLHTYTRRRDSIISVLWQYLLENMTCDFIDNIYYNVGTFPTNEWHTSPMLTIVMLSESFLKHTAANVFFNLHRNNRNNRNNFVDSMSLVSIICDFKWKLLCSHLQC